MTPEDRAKVEEAMKNPDIPPVVREQVLKGLANGAKSDTTSGKSAPVISNTVARAR